jgi:hypothetical protein
MMISQPIVAPLQLYEQDYHHWLETTAQQLRDGNLAALDIENLLEEIEDMGRSEKRSVYSNLKILLLHLLKYHYQPEKRIQSWMSSIVEHRQRLNKALKDSPSLKSYYAEIFAEAYQDARELAAAETGINVDDFPIDCPFSPEAILRSDDLPEDQNPYENTQNPFRLHGLAPVGRCLSANTGGVGDDFPGSIAGKFAIEFASARPNNYRR